MTEQTHWKPLACSAILLMVLVVVAFSQGRPSGPVPTCDVTGIVTDLSGAVIATANVVFERGSETVTVQTGTAGSVHLRLPPGHYVVTVSLRGFKTIRVADFAAEADTPSVLKVVLEPGKAEQQIIRDGEAPQAPTQASDLPNRLIEGTAAYKDTEDIPAAGYVPDSATAIRIAEAVMAAQFGEKKTRSMRPFTASLYEEVWTVTRHCKSWCVGINPTVKILKRDGRVISLKAIYLK